MAWLGDIAALSKAWWRSFVAISGLEGSQVSYTAKYCERKALAGITWLKTLFILIANMVSRLRKGPKVDWHCMRAFNNSLIWKFIACMMNSSLPVAKWRLTSAMMDITESSTESF